MWGCILKNLKGEVKGEYNQCIVSINEIGKILMVWQKLYHQILINQWYELKLYFENSFFKKNKVK